MMTSTIALLAIGKMTTHAPYIEKIDVTVTTGADDLRGDSGAMVVLGYSDSRHQIGALNPRGASLGSNSSKTITITPNVPNLTLGDLERIRVDFSSGKGTGFDDHWSLQGVKVTATVGGNEVPIYSNDNLGMHLMYTQHWSSPFFRSAAVNDVVNPSEIYATIEGGDMPPSNSNVLMDLETEDGLSWQGDLQGSMFARTDYPGARVESRTTDKISVRAIRAIRLKCENASWNLRGVRFNYKTSRGEIKELVSYNEINVPMNGGWWETPILKAFKRSAGVPVKGLIVEVLTGADDLRRLNLPPDQDAHYSSKVDIKIATPLLPTPRYPNWLMNSNYVRHSISQTQPLVLQDGDEFPQGWTGRFGSWGKFQKVFLATGGDPYFISSDFSNMAIQFKQGQGGNLLPTKSSGGGIIQGLMQSDQWDLHGVIVSIVGTTGPIHRIYSNFAINQRMSSDGQTWKSKNFNTLLLRARPR